MVNNNVMYVHVRDLYLHAAFFNDIVVGGVCCRIETEGDQRRLYIMTLGVLAPYRRLGIGKNRLQVIKRFRVRIPVTVDPGIFSRNNTSLTSNACLFHIQYKLSHAGLKL